MQYDPLGFILQEERVLCSVLALANNGMLTRYHLRRLFLPPGIHYLLLAILQTSTSFSVPLNCVLSRLFYSSQ